MSGKQWRDSNSVTDYRSVVFNGRLYERIPENSDNREECDKQSRVYSECKGGANQKAIRSRIIGRAGNAVLHWDGSDETIRCCERCLSEESGEPSGFGLNSQMQSFAKKYFTSGTDIEITEALLSLRPIYD